MSCLGLLKALLGVAALGAVLLMGVLTMIFSASSATTGVVTIADANTSTAGPARTAPATPSAVPGMKATPFLGGDFAGFGTFAGGDWTGG